MPVLVKTYQINTRNRTEGFSMLDLWRALERYSPPHAGGPNIAIGARYPMMGSIIGLGGWLGLSKSARLKLEDFKTINNGFLPLPPNPQKPMVVILLAIMMTGIFFSAKYLQDVRRLLWLAAEAGEDQVAVVSENVAVDAENEEHVNKLFF